MATLDQMLAEQKEIKATLQRMEDDESVTDEEHGDLRDTLVARWKKLDDDTKPIIARMEEIRAITRAKDDPANTEPPAGGTGNGNGTISRYGNSGPDLVIRTSRDPYDNN